MKVLESFPEYYKSFLELALKRDIQIKLSIRDSNKYKLIPEKDDFWINDFEKKYPKMTSSVLESIGLKFQALFLPKIAGRSLSIVPEKKQEDSKSSEDNNKTATEIKPEGEDDKKSSESDISIIKNDYIQKGLDKMKDRRLTLQQQSASKTDP